MFYRRWMSSGAVLIMWCSGSRFGVSCWCDVFNCIYYITIILYLILYSSLSPLLPFSSSSSNLLSRSPPNIPFSPNPLLPNIPSSSCRYLLTLIYIPDSSNNSTPHVLSEWMVEVCAGDLWGVRVLSVLVIDVRCYIVYYIILLYIIYYIIILYIIIHIIYYYIIILLYIIHTYTYLYYILYSSLLFFYSSSVLFLLSFSFPTPLPLLSSFLLFLPFPPFPIILIYLPSFFPILSPLQSSHSF